MAEILEKKQGFGRLIMVSLVKQTSVRPAIASLRLITPLGRVL